MIVFVTTVKNRTQHLELTLPKNLANNKNSKFVVLDYNSKDNLLEYLSSYQEEIASGKLTVYSLLLGPNGPVPFNMTRAKNMAHRLGILEGGDILVNLDADNYTGENFDQYIQEIFEAAKDIFLWSKMQPGKLSRGISGRIAVTKDAFLKVGGYNEKYKTWSPDDKDFNARLQRIGYIPREIHERYLLAVSHNNKMRFKEYKEARNMTYEDFDISEDDTTIANFSKLGVGTVFRNFDFSKAIELKPIPTRIFGIGMHKTLTTSLHTALKILGYDSAHWLNAHWAKSIYTEMKSMGKSSTLEKHYALCDLPITVLFKELDQAYPGSKFILTTRDENEWLVSVKKHFDNVANPFRKQWNKDPFSHFIHKQIYGQKNFNAEVFLKRYRHHDTEVMEYFADRPDDLLILDSDNSWNKLCLFLGNDVPTIPYPRMNESKISTGVDL